MAITVTSKLTSFKVNGSSKAFVKLTGKYDTADILNGGETLENELEYTFNIKGLNEHIIGVIYIKSLLLDNTGDLCPSRKLSFDLNSVKYSGLLNTSDSIKTIINTPFVFNELLLEDEINLVLKVTSNDIESCYYGLHSLLIELSDIPYTILLRFTGPKNYRTASNIEVANSIINRGSVDVTFSKDVTRDYDSSIHTEPGKIYFLQDGIYVDGYLHSVNTPATLNKAGIVKLQDEFEIGLDGGIVAPIDIGVAASPLLVYSVVLPATTEIRGTVVLQNTFEIDENTLGIIAPTETGIAASPLLVYNTLATAKNYIDTLIGTTINYVDELIDAVLGGIEAPVNMYIEKDDNTTSAITDSLTFSKEFGLDGLKMLHINWLEIVN